MHGGNVSWVLANIIHDSSLKQHFKDIKVVYTPLFWISGNKEATPSKLPRGVPACQQVMSYSSRLLPDQLRPLESSGTPTLGSW